MQQKTAAQNEILSMKAFENRNVCNKQNFVEKVEVHSFIIVNCERPENCFLNPNGIIIDEFLKTIFFYITCT